MITGEPLLVTVVKLVDCIPVPPPSDKRRQGRPRVYSDRLFLKALIIMLLRHLHTVHALLAVLGEPTAESSKSLRCSTGSSVSSGLTWHSRLSIILNWGHRSRPQP